MTMFEVLFNCYNIFIFYRFFFYNYLVFLLHPIGNSYFVPAEDAQIEESTDFDIIQGMLEGSNVDSTEAFTDMITSQRAFQMNSKALTVADDLWGMINSMR